LEVKKKKKGVIKVFTILMALAVASTSAGALAVSQAGVLATSTSAGALTVSPANALAASQAGGNANAYDFTQGSKFMNTINTIATACFIVYNLDAMRLYHLRPSESIIFAVTLLNPELVN
jgi:hypothetical protein